MEPFTAPVWSERRGLFLAGQLRPLASGPATEPSIAGLCLETPWHDFLGGELFQLGVRRPVYCKACVRVCLCICTLARTKFLLKDEENSPK